MFFLFSEVIRFIIKTTAESFRFLLIFYFSFAYSWPHLLHLTELLLWHLDRLFLLHLLNAAAFTHAVFNTAFESSFY